MSKKYYFFERDYFEDTSLKKPYYLYKGYYTESEEKSPVILHFGRDEIVISYKHDYNGKIAKVFSLYVADGGLNQMELTEAIENYWNMPLWPLNSNLQQLKVNKVLASISYFARIYEFDVMDNEFVKFPLFNRKLDDFKLSKKYIELKYLSIKKPKVNKEAWEIDDNGICAFKINFRRILLDFLFELEYTDTFEDDFFFKLQPTLKNNKLLDALSRKCNYLYELNHVRAFEKTKANQMLPKRFTKAEKAWLSVCFNDEDYSEVFNSEKSIFKPVEEEAELVVFKSYVGKYFKNRNEYFTKDDTKTRNQAATLFLRKYDLYNAFRTLLHPTAIFILPFLLLSIPFAFGYVFFADDNANSLKTLKTLSEISSIGIPLLLLVTFTVYYLKTEINLFKLLLPRLFLGILIGWSIFWSTEELWKAALISNSVKILILNVVLVIIIFLYIFTDIKNKLIRAARGTVFKRASMLLLLAMLISFIQGFYVIQFQAKPMLENSGFIKDNYRFLTEVKQNGSAEDKQNGLTEVERNRIHHIEKSKDIFGLKFCYLDSRPILNEEIRIYHIWSIHFSQFVMSILIGIVLQLLWEDRPITEPL